MFLLMKNLMNCCSELKGRTFFERTVHEGFKINTGFDRETYSELCRVLGLKYDPNNPFSPKYLFEEFDNKVPSSVALRDVPTTAQISTYRNIEEEPDKIYFWRWIFHDGIKSNAKPENLDKTRRLLGLKAYNACKREISVVGGVQTQLKKRGIVNI